MTVAHAKPLRPAPGPRSGRHGAMSAANCSNLARNAGSRHRPRRSARPISRLLSVLALLALAVLPGPRSGRAHAKSTYETGPPDTDKATTSENEPIAQQVRRRQRRRRPGRLLRHRDRRLRVKSRTGGVSIGGRRRARRVTVRQAPRVAQAAAQSSGGKTPHSLLLRPPQPGSDGGSSSPLVPILIAIAALAAISIGVVMVSQRRQRGRPGGGLSTRAG